MSEKNVYAAIAAVMAEVGAVGKDDVNEQQRFRYRSIDSLVNAVSPVMARHGVIIVPDCSILSQEERTTRSGTAQVLATVEFRFRVYGPAGDFVEGRTIGQGIDMSDKAMNKAMTAGFKYAIAQVFAVPFAGVDEGDAHTIERAEARTPTLKEMHERLTSLAEVVGKSVEEVTQQFRDRRGGIDMDAFYALPVEVIVPFVNQVSNYVSRRSSED